MAIRCNHEKIWMFLAKHGSVFEIAANSDSVIEDSGIVFRQGKCFLNAIRLSVHSRGALTYTEGLATLYPTLRHANSVLHAWCVDAQKRVVDPSPGWHNRAWYCGVPFSIDYFFQAQTTHLRHPYPRSNSTVLTYPPIISGVHPEYPGVGTPDQLREYRRERSVSLAAMDQHVSRRIAAKVREAQSVYDFW